MRCDHCGSRVRYRERVCPECRQPLENGIKAGGIAIRAVAAVFAGLLLIGAGLFIGASYPARADIAILYTNDVHCAIDEDIGYAGLTACRNAALEKTP